MVATTIEHFPKTHQARIESSGTQSNDVNCAAYASGHVFCPAMDGSNLTFQQLDPSDGTTWRGLQDSTGSAYTVPITANTWIALPVEMILSCDHFRVVSDATETASRVLYFRMTG